MTQLPALSLLLLSLGLWPLAQGDLSIHVGVADDSEVFDHLSALNGTALVDLFGNDTVKFTAVAPIAAGQSLNAYATSIASQAFHAVVGTYSSELASVCTSLGLPLYAVSRSNEFAGLSLPAFLNSSTVLLMNDVSEALTLSAVNFTSYVVGKSSITVITDDASVRLDSLMEYSNGMNVQLVITNTDRPGDEIRSALFKVQNYTSPSTTVYMIFSVNDTGLFASAILQEAVYLSMMNSNSTWLIPQLFVDDSVLLPYRKNDGLLVTFHLLTDVVTNRTHLRQVLAEDGIRHFLRGLAANNGSMTDIMDTILQTRSTGSVASVSFNRLTRRNRLYNFRLKATDALNATALVPLGTWNQSTGGEIVLLRSLKTSLLPKLRVVGRLLEPFVMQKAEGAQTGFSINMLSSLAKDLFTYDLRLTSAYLDLVRKGSADLAIIPVDVVQYRADANLTLSELPVVYSGISALGHSTLTEMDFLSPLYPLTWNVWFAIIVAFVVLSITLYLTDKISPNDYKRPKFTVSKAVFFVYSSFVMSKLKSTAIKPSSRIFILILWIGSLMYCTSYGTNFFYLVIRSDADLPFTNLGGLYNQSASYYWMMDRNSEEYWLLSNQTSDSLYRKLADGTTKFVSGIAEGSSILQNSTIAGQKKPIFIGDELLVSYQGLRNCNLKFAGVNELTRKFHLAISKTVSATLLKQINLRIQSMTDQGNLEELKSRYWVKADCSANDKLINYADLQQVTIDKLAGIFIVLAAAFALSFVVLIMEHVAYLIGLQIQRKRADPKLEFGQSYRATVTSITPSGVVVKLHGEREFIPNEMLSPDPSKKTTASDLQITYGTSIEIIYYGNNPDNGARIFKRRG